MQGMSNIPPGPGNFGEPAAGHLPIELRTTSGYEHQLFAQIVQARDAGLGISAAQTTAYPGQRRTLTVWAEEPLARLLLAAAQVSAGNPIHANQRWSVAQGHLELQVANLLGEGIMAYASMNGAHGGCRLLWRPRHEYHIDGVFEGPSELARSTYRLIMMGNPHSGALPRRVTLRIDEALVSDFQGSPELRKLEKLGCEVWLEPWSDRPAMRYLHMLRLDLASLSRSASGSR